MRRALRTIAMQNAMVYGPLYTFLGLICVAVALPLVAVYAFAMALLVMAQGFEKP